MPTTLALALLVAAPALKDPPAKPPPSVVGEWELDSQTFAGRPRPPVGGAAGPLRYAFGPDHTWVIYRGERRVGLADRAYFADPKADPPTIDLKYEPADQDGRVLRGVYKVEGDRLTLCLSRGDVARPKAFESSADAPTILYVFRRVKKD